MALNLTIQTPNKTVFEGEVDSVHLKTEEGEMEVLPGHAALQGAIGFSNVRVRHGAQDERFLLRQGIVLVGPDQDRVRLLGYAADKAGELSRTSAEDYLKTIREALAKKEDLSKYQIQFLEEQQLVVGELKEKITE